MQHSQRFLKLNITGLAALALLLCAPAPSLSAQPIVIASEAGHFRVRITGVERVETVNHLHGFELLLTTADGKPATNASISVSGQRQFSINPLPTMPRISPGPDGSYRGDGLRFHMPGAWHLVFDIQFAQTRDRAVLDIIAK
jgi:hypothetical protein